MRGSSGRITQTWLPGLHREEILKKLRALLPAKSQLHGGARGVLPRQRCKVQKMCQTELVEKREEEQRGLWLNRIRPMTKMKQTWHEKRLAREENSNSSDSRSEGEVGVTSDEGESTSDKGSSNPDKGSNLDKGEDQQEERPTQMEINMVLSIPAEFRAPIEDVAELTIGAECVVFEKPDNPGAHMKPLFIHGHLDGTPIVHMLVDGSESITILLLSLFKKFGHIKCDLKHTNLSLSGFAGDPTEANGIICMELMVGSKTMPTAFFMVDVKGCYNVLLGQDWIHMNECVPSTLHQCMIQWVSDEVEMVQADEDVCIAMTESQVDIQGGKMKCLTSRDLSGYNYVSVGKDGFVPISVKLAIDATRLAHDLV
jgi:hypothetical protein